MHEWDVSPVRQYADVRISYKHLSTHSHPFCEIAHTRFNVLFNDKLHIFGGKCGVAEHKQRGNAKQEAKRAAKLF